MSLLESILGNSTVANLAFGQLKNLFAEKNLEFIAVKLDENGEVELELYKKGEATVVPIPEGLTADQVIRGVAAHVPFPRTTEPEKIKVGNRKRKGGK